MNLWLTLIAAGILTYAIRLSFILLFGRRDVPPVAQRVLAYVPPAVLSALVFPSLLLRDGSLFISPLNFRLIAALVAIIAAWRSRNVLVTILVGMAVLWLLQALFG